jgi:hypothetical protein
MRTCQNISRRLAPPRAATRASRRLARVQARARASQPQARAGASLSATRYLRWSSKSAGPAWMSCSGGGASHRSRDGGHCPADPLARAKGSARPRDATWPPRSTSPESPTWSSWKPAATPGGTPGAASSPRPTSRWWPPTPNHASPRTRRGTPPVPFRRPPSTTGRSSDRPEKDCGPSCRTPTSASPWRRRPSRSPSCGTSTPPRSATRSRPPTCSGY